MQLIVHMFLILLLVVHFDAAFQALRPFGRSSPSHCIFVCVAEYSQYVYGICFDLANQCICIALQNIHSMCTVFVLTLTRCFPRHLCVLCLTILVVRVRFVWFMATSFHMFCVL